jgi:hypothetical protein
VTFALITWSVSDIAGAITVLLCVIGCGVLALVDARTSYGP